MTTIILLLVVAYCVIKHKQSEKAATRDQLIAEMRETLAEVARAETLLKSVGYVVYVKKSKERAPTD